MRNHRSGLLLFFCLSALHCVVCQTETRTMWRPFLHSRQGQPGEPDIVDHKQVSKGANLVCYQVESYPKQQGDDGRACLLRFKDGSKHILSFKQSMRMAKDDELFLACLGDKPTLCSVGVWYDSPATQPQ